MNKSFGRVLIFGGVAIALLIILFLAGGVFSGWQSGGSVLGYGPWGFGPWMMGPWMMLMPIIMIFFFSFIFWGVFGAARGESREGCHGDEPGSSDSALDILKRRFARGEINKEEFDEKKKALI